MHEAYSFVTSKILGIAISEPGFWYEELQGDSYQDWKMPATHRCWIVMCC